MSRPEMSVQHDVTTIGETMVAFVSRDGSTTFQAIAAGAESNVARTLAGLGLAARWVSRLGDDPLGDFLEQRVAESGADVEVVRDPNFPTGVMTKHISGSTTASQYYRSQSAARGLSPADLERAGSSRWIHVTGITPALSASAAELVEAVMANTGGFLVSFDFNYRPALWRDEHTAAETLRNLARRADVVFIGDDEAEALYPAASDHAGLAVLILERADQELIVKQG
ncbi:MAG: sugar kinase, partial [Acidimicrobiia bacterium]|nr:sugar kinase [Acidimicrobiia bacterium]